MVSSAKIMVLTVVEKVHIVVSVVFSPVVILVVENVGTMVVLTMCLNIVTVGIRVSHPWFLVM